MEELDLKIFLEKHRGQNVDFYRFPGNYGDSLIWHGTKILLKELDITENYVEIDSIRNNDTLFIDGGGNFVDYYSDVRDFLIAKSGS
jgi:exopolysaccharide biosynthesis predicted pyruvyltransferase EpsI